MKITLKGFKVPKQNEHYSDCEDNFAYNPDFLRFAISDGVSRSFFPKVWSKVLVNQYVSKKFWEENEFIAHCQKEWQKEIAQIVQQPNIKYYTKNAYYKKVPACATFLGLQIFPEQKKWICQVLGDTFLFFVPDNFQSFEKVQIVTNKPEPIEFDNYPDYLVSIGNKHKGDPKKLKNQRLTEGTFYLMTDALAEWFLKLKENAIYKTQIWEKSTDFERFINEAREMNELKDDDCSIMIIHISEMENPKVDFVVESFSDIPSSERLEQNTSNTEANIENPLESSTNQN